MPVNESLRERAKRSIVIMPTRPFLFTLDQIGLMLQLTESDLIGRYLFLVGRSTFTVRPFHLRAHNIAPPDCEPEWRVAEFELLRWLGYHGFEHRDAAEVGG